MEGSERPPAHQRQQPLAQSNDFDLVLNTSQITTPGRIDVLHVDDDESILDLSATLLEKNHGLLSIHSKLDAKEALDYLETNDIDCIVSDYDMPGLNGIEFLEQVREVHPDIPFILYTGKGSEEVASKAISKGVTDYLQKGTGTEQYELLANRIENAVAQRRSERRANKIERWLVELAEETTNILWIFTADMDDVIFINSAFEELYGIPIDRLRDDPMAFLDATHPEDRRHVAKAVERLRNGQTVEIEHRVNESEDYQRWVYVQGKPIRTDDGEVTRVVGFITDVTERKEREQQLRKFQRAVESSGHAIYCTDTDGIIDYVNPAFEEITGYTAEEAIGENPAILQSGEHEQAFYEDLWQTILDGDVWRNEVVNERKDGERFVIDQTIAPVTDESGETTHFVAVNNDITEQRATERKLEILQTAIDNAHAPLTLTDPHKEDNPMVYVNKAFEDLTGYTESEALGRNCRFLQGDGTDPETVARLREAIDNEEPITVEIRNYRKDGTPFWNELSVAPVYDADGDLIRYLGTQRDVTDRKERTQELQRQNDRLEEFASVVSHDLRNPLNVAEGRLQLAKDECESEELSHVEGALDRMGALIDDLLTLARQGETITDFESIELAALVEKCWATVETTSASLVVEIDSETSIQGDASRLKQVFENLIRNAVEHGGPDVTVTVGELDNGFYVADDGPGIPEEDRGQIFDAGYSTADAGTGFGLSIVDQIVGAHGWSIQATESEAGGVRFEITGVSGAGSASHERVGGNNGGDPRV
ncbi:PAS domain S-box protein [Haloplanus salinarum]|uniref:PAS domain S-box protein n=1 Tax=Haloplanus salinarum TaxID=1912324 RepID=UPI00214BC7BC|nr:PAS domain S-box protein [Haloplanus salinarum]